MSSPDGSSAILDRIDGLDVSLFDAIEGQTSEDDRRSFLALESACRQWKQGPFTMLEIGSYKGGSLQALVADPTCARIVSLDPRPAVVRDERGMTFDYSQETAERMLGRLATVPGANVAKVTAITAGTTTTHAADLGILPDFCFIDGEHTDEASLRDARFCLNVAADDCAIAFHDANIVYAALRAFLGEVASTGREFRAYNLPATVFVVEVGNCRLSEYEPLRSWRTQNYKGYLASLEANDHFRQIAKRHQRLAEHPIVRLPRRLGLETVARKWFGW